MDEKKEFTKDQIETLKKGLSERVEGLHFLSETDSPIETVELSDTEDVRQKLIAESAEKDSALSELSFDDFFQMNGIEKDWQNEVQKDFARKFGDALKVMQSALQDVHVFRVGGVRANLYILGKTSPDSWLGFKTLIVET